MTRAREKEGPSALSLLSRSPLSRWWSGTLCRSVVLPKLGCGMERGRGRESERPPLLCVSEDIMGTLLLRSFFCSPSRLRFLSSKSDTAPSATVKRARQRRK